MTAVLLDSRKNGSSGWVSIRTNTHLKAEGIQAGDALRLHFKPEGELSVDEDGIFPIPQGVEFVRVEHIIANGNGVSVDLLRKAS